jgi:arylsulfatase A-like enzyme
VTLAVTGAFAAALGTGSTTPGQAALGPGRPNVIVVETDDQTRGSMRVMDNVKSLIGNRGARFRRSFVNFALCCPSRTTFLTGQYAHNHRVLDNKAPYGAYHRFEPLHADNNLAVWLQDSGYRTALVGKYLNGYEDRLRPPPGWSEWYAAIGDDQDVYRYQLSENGNPVSYGRDPSDFKQDVLTRKAVDFVDRSAPNAQPFFLWLAYTAPHGSGLLDPNARGHCRGTATPAPRHARAFDSKPLPMPPNFNERRVADKPDSIRNRPRLTAHRITNLRRIYRCQLESLLSVDEGVKKVVQALVAGHELANTLLIFTSDNGFFNGAHRIFRGKEHLYEESIRVPLQMRGPGIPRGVTIDELAINADLAPTIVDVTNATPGLEMDGRSLMPVVRKPGIERERQLLIEQPLGMYRGFHAIRTERYMYGEHNNGEKELYDLRWDPFELRNRYKARAYSSIRATLSRRLHRLSDCAGPSCRLHPPPP